MLPSGIHLLFVDDDPNEIQTFSALYSGPQFITTTVLAELPEEAVANTVRALKGATPDLLVLDLYFRRSAEMPEGFDNLPNQRRQQLEAPLKHLEQGVCDLRAAFEQHAKDGSRLLRESHAVVHRSRAILDSWCKELGQSREGGLSLLRAMDKQFPNVPKVFYSRKATLKDARAALAGGAIDVLSKPDPSAAVVESAEIAKCFARYAGSRPPGFLSKWFDRWGARLKLSATGPEGEVWIEGSRD